MIWPISFYLFSACRCLVGISHLLSCTSLLQTHSVRCPAFVPVPPSSRPVPSPVPFSSTSHPVSRPISRPISSRLPLSVVPPYPDSRPFPLPHLQSCPILPGFVSPSHGSFCSISSLNSSRLPVFPCPRSQRHPRLLSRLLLLSYFLCVPVRHLYPYVPVPVPISPVPAPSCPFPRSFLS